MSAVTFLKGMNSLSKITEMSYPKGTVVRTINHFLQKPLSCEVVKAKHVYLSPDNPLYKAGLKLFSREVTNNGTVHLSAVNCKDERVASGLKSIKNLIESIKKYGLKF